eukprot:CAMPEP_0116958644 /NCGR_PEP_ID=MMETSP0467-20121206/44772_1 /TAXON_ID=283647 /ORGANISM="Mesodinium pulex, Strain SPMC105" /LENGTH=84 /DNA_ID=CAMNT_0004645789 /DNA_START=734 /DNA_END=988 /DNA_ORIENTATION=+
MAVENTLKEKQAQLDQIYVEAKKTESFTNYNSILEEYYAVKKQHLELQSKNADLDTKSEEELFQLKGKMIREAGLNLITNQSSN